MKTKKKKKSENWWPKNLTAEEIRQQMEQIASEVDSCQNDYLELRRELTRRRLKV